MNGENVTIAYFPGGIKFEISASLHRAREIFTRAMQDKTLLEVSCRDKHYLVNPLQMIYLQVGRQEKPSKVD